ncbi:MAG: hypothetical protein QNJ42_04505 [Crocosphaera sp.]|nr:hypothetical protein [Crocosphaera sp.]
MSEIFNGKFTSGEFLLQDKILTLDPIARSCRIIEEDKSIRIFYRISYKEKTMNKSSLDSALVKLIGQKEGPEKIIVQLARQVWQIDWTVSGYEIVSHYLAFDIPYFYRFMSIDIGDEAEEKQILIDWISSRHLVTKEVKQKIPALLDELNAIKSEARKA